MLVIDTIGADKCRCIKCMGMRNSKRRTVEPFRGGMGSDGGGAPSTGWSWFLKLNGGHTGFHCVNLNAFGGHLLTIKK